MICTDFVVFNSMVIYRYIYIYLHYVMQSGLCEMALLLFKINQVLEELRHASCVCVHAVQRGRLVYLTLLNIH